MTTPFPPHDATRAEVEEWQREAYYDREIAPKLAEIAKDCEAHGMSLVAVVEWAARKGGVTIYEAADASVSTEVARMAARCNGNVDALVMGLLAHARKHGHRSMYLSTLGVPATPEGGQ